ncbi:MAG: Gfo/Idh/MocA family protein [Anaerorhabdus sp.]
MRFGIVGTNFISDIFVFAAKQVAGVEVVAVCSGKKENAEKFSEKHNISLVFDDYISMMESKEIDAIYLGVPNSKHYEMTMECLRHKIATFTEKPFASNYEEAYEMVQYANKNKTYLHDGFVPAYTPNIQLLKKEIEQIKPLRHVVLSFGKYSSRYDSYLRGENPTTFRKELSNGSLMDIGVYPLGVAVILFGKPLKIIATAHLLATGVDGMGTCLFEYDGFEVVVLHSKISDTKIESEFQGENGLIQVDGISRVKEIKTQRRNEKEISIIGDETEGFIYQIEDFVKNCNEQRLESTVFPHQTSLDIIEVLDECRRQTKVTYPADHKKSS